MRIHLPALPGQPVTKANSTCAFTNKVVRFAEMMGDDYEIVVYGDPRHDDLDCEYVPCYPETEPPDFTPIGWESHNMAAHEAILERQEPGDVLAIIGGVCQSPLAGSLDDVWPVEFGIGYPGSFAPFRIFESYAWMNATYGREADTLGHMNPPFYDAVIPGYFDASEFQSERDDMGYLLYVGRLIERKGVSIAVETAKRLGMLLLLAGDGDYRPEYELAEYLGVVSIQQRNALMAGATALLAPTIYSEPFGNIVPEAHLNGCPTVTTDFGAFPETNIHGFTGYRARTLGELCDAVQRCSQLDSDAIREHAIANYSYEAIRPRYQAYFEQLMTLNSDGWYSDWSGLHHNRYGYRPATAEIPATLGA